MSRTICGDLTSSESMTWTGWFLYLIKKYTINSGTDRNSFITLLKTFFLDTKLPDHTSTHSRVMSHRLVSTLLMSQKRRHFSGQSSLNWRRENNEESGDKRPGDNTATTTATTMALQCPELSMVSRWGLHLTNLSTTLVLVSILSWLVTITQEQLVRKERRERSRRRTSGYPPTSSTSVT